MADCFAAMEPTDGLDVFATTTNGQFGLYLSYFQGLTDTNERRARPLPTQPDASTELLLLACDKDDVVAVGSLARLQAALDGVCRYLNVGGEWDELISVLASLRRAVPYGQQFPGYYYFDTTVPDLATEHIFAKVGGHLFGEPNVQGSAVVWSEDEFVDTERCLRDFLPENKQDG